MRTEEADEQSLRARAPTGSRRRQAARKVILIATGSEVEIALDVAEMLEGQGIGADVVSMPCTEYFDAQAPAYREDILPDVSNREILRVSIEAGATFGWERYTGLHGLAHRDRPLRRLGAGQGPYEYFGLTRWQDRRAGDRLHETREIA